MTDQEVVPPSFDTCDNVSDRCPVEATLFGDYFTTGACAFFVAAYSILLLAQAYFGWRSKAWSFAAWLAVGTICELMGYVGRTLMISNPWNFGSFMAQQMGLVLGPTFIAAAISITFKHLVLWYGPEWSVLRPTLYPWVFVGTDIFSIVIQGTGGGVSSAAGNDADGQKLVDVGNNLLIAGVSFQVVNMVFCGGLMLIYIWRRRAANKTGKEQLAPANTNICWQNSTEQERAKTTWFVRALALAYVAIIIRCIYRIPEMALGWGSSLMQNETTFLILDGAMILIAVITLTATHPALLFPYIGKANRKEPPTTSSSEQEEIEMNRR